MWHPLEIKICNATKLCLFNATTLLMWHHPNTCWMMLYCACVLSPALTSVRWPETCQLTMLKTGHFLGTEHFFLNLHSFNRSRHLQSVRWRLIRDEQVTCNIYYRPVLEVSNIAINKIYISFWSILYVDYNKQTLFGLPWVYKKLWAIITQSRWWKKVNCFFSRKNTIATCKGFPTWTITCLLRNRLVLSYCELRDSISKLW